MATTKKRGERKRGKNESRKYFNVRKEKFPLPLTNGRYDVEAVDRLKSKITPSIVPDYSPNSISVLEMRYFRKDEDRTFQEDVDGMLRRVSAYVAYPDLHYNGGNEGLALKTANAFYDIMASREFLPNSPTLMNAGRKMGMLSACFVLPIGDSIDEIFDSVKATAQIQKAGGGTGFSFDNLRPTGDYISSSGGTTSGPISFWKVFAETTSAIQQGAFRRGANMGMMSVNHPDILKFITAKEEDGSFSNYNISIKITDNWMNEMKGSSNSPLIVRNPRTGDEYLIPKDLDIKTYELSNLIPLSEQEIDFSSVWTKRELWDIMINKAHANGEPGVVYIDRMNEGNPTPDIGRIEATNPCGEQPLLDYEACNLGSINVGRMSKDRKLDKVRLRKVTRLGVRFLDNVIDANQFPHQKITEIVRGNRKIGLGIMGFADLLTSLRIQYGSKESIQLAEDLMSTIQRTGQDESRRIAKERGAFPNFDKSVYAGKAPRRNATITTIAPTGTISIIAGASSGLEPFFHNGYIHRDSAGNERKFINEVLRKDLKANGLDADAIFKELFAGKSLSDLDIPDWIKSTYVTAHNIPVEQQIAMQAAFQNHVDNAVSKTINLPRDAPVKDVEKAYLLAFEMGCKGVTVYRDGSRENQVISSGKQENDLEKSLVGSINNPIKVPVIMPALKIRQDTPFGHIHTSIVFDPKNDYKTIEAFSQIGNSGSQEAADFEALGRMTSLYVRGGGNLESVIEQLIRIGSGSATVTRAGPVKSLAMGYAKSLLKFVVAKNHYAMEDILLGRVDYDQFGGEVEDLIRTNTVKNLLKGNGTLKQKELENMGEDKKKNIVASSEKLSAFDERCPECKDGILMNQEGCLKCSSCGYSHC